MKTQFIQSIQKYDKFGTGICLERINHALTTLGLSDKLAHSEIVVITGTNGKGSTASKLSHLLMADNRDTAVFTSPHFVEFNQRFCHQGKNIPYPELHLNLQQLQPTLAQLQTDLNQQYGRFEVLFLLALITFTKRKVKNLIIEAGIGGMYDPTKCLSAPLSTITSLDLEHTELLGNSLEQIAIDKFGVLPANGHCILGQLTYPQDLKREQAIAERLTAVAGKNQSTLSFARDEIAVKQIETSDNANNTSKKQNILIDLKDAQQQPFTVTAQHQSPIELINWQTAIALLKHMPSTKTSWTQKVVQKAFNNTHTPGRFEIINQAPEIIIDAAHTPAAYQWLFDIINQNYQDQSLIFIAGLSKGRNIEQFKQQIAPLLASPDNMLITTQSDNGIDAFELGKILAAQFIYQDIGQAIEQALTIARQNNSRIFVVGGLFLAASASAYMKNIPYNDLHSG